jgi:hypothetical protein
VSGAWAGPTNFTGQFFGTKYTANFNLSQFVAVETYLGAPAQSLGLFTSCGKCGIYDLTVNAKTVDAAGEKATLSSDTHLWGGILIGHETGAATIKNVTVSGDISFAASSGIGYLEVGGFIGYGGGSAAIYQSASHVNISIDCANKVGTCACAPFVANLEGGASIEDSYATGDISIVNSKGLWIGGTGVSANRYYNSGTITISASSASGFINGTVSVPRNCVNLCTEVNLSSTALIDIYHRVGGIGLTGSNPVNSYGLSAVTTQQGGYTYMPGLSDLAPARITDMATSTTTSNDGLTYDDIDAAFWRQRVGFNHDNDVWDIPTWGAPTLK